MDAVDESLDHGLELRSPCTRPSRRAGPRAGRTLRSVVHSSYPRETGLTPGIPGRRRPASRPRGLGRRRAGSQSWAVRAASPGAARTSRRRRLARVLRAGGGARAHGTRARQGGARGRAVRADARRRDRGGRSEGERHRSRWSIEGVERAAKVSRDDLETRASGRRGRGLWRRARRRRSVGEDATTRTRAGMGTAGSA